MAIKKMLLAGGAEARGQEQDPQLWWRSKLKLSLSEICELTGEAMPLIRAAINAGDLNTFIVGRRRFARPAEVVRWVDSLQAQSDAGQPVKYQARQQAAV